MNARIQTEDTDALIDAHGLSVEEYDRIIGILDRAPNLVELGIFSVMWSEHCSYKTTRPWLKLLPTKAEHVICGPGENAGIIDIGDNQAAIFKMESHNHPSFIEPFHGAATGVGGIMRDVFTMGARPVALMNSLRFGSMKHPKTRNIVQGVVAGISHYGNCVGVPNVGGECIFHESYNTNPLVNAMCVGIADQDKIFYSKASGVGHPVIYVGAKTGRDGIHGATMASTEFSEGDENKRPTVQVGDPFKEKLLIEACLELMATDAIVAIQDMGAAGLTCSSLEMAGKGGLGIALCLNDIPQREQNMSAYDMMLSESQERMLMVLKPDRVELAQRIFDKWDLDAAVIGTLTNTGRMVLTHQNEIVCDIPIAPLSEEAPVYQRPYVRTPSPKALDAASVLAPSDLGLALKKLLQSPDICAKRWVYEQYDSQVMNDTLALSGGDAGLIRVHGTNKALAISTDCTPRYVAADPYMGALQALAENWRNIISVGAKPLAVTDCLNFGNPEKPEIMGQIVGAIEGLRDGCQALSYPVVSGNVSLYNETEGAPIQPTPAIGGVGLLADIEKRLKNHFTKVGDIILLIGETHGHMGQSLYLREQLKREDGPPPPVDMALEKSHGEMILQLNAQGLLSACHDVSDGGMLVALAEMCMAQNIGAQIALPNGLAPHIYGLGEDQARYLVSVPRAHKDQVLMLLNQANIYFDDLGKTIADALIVEGHLSVNIQVLRDYHEAVLPEYMDQKL
jgi:phosphoribosylformylglycinamidine synthase